MFTALMVCCASRQREDTTFQIAELLLGSHANVNAQDRFKMTPFLYATKLFHLTLLPLLSRSGASVNKQEMRGWSVGGTNKQLNSKLIFSKLSSKTFYT